MTKRYIDADELKAKVEAKVKHRVNESDYEFGCNQTLDYVADILIDEAPTIDAVEVVRCKDCRHRDLFSCPLADNDFQKDDDFCSWGERKGGDTE